MQPRFSVVIPVHDGAAVVGRAVASVLAQTFEDLEVVVVDAASTDQTVTAVKATGGSRVRLVRHRSNDLASALAAGVEVATGSWTTMLAATDEVRPSWLAHLARLQDRSGAAMVICGAATLRADDTAIIDRPDAAHLSIGSGTVAAASQRWRTSGGESMGDHSTSDAGIDSIACRVGESLRRSVLADGGEIVETNEVLVHHHAAPAAGSMPGEQLCGDELRLRWAMQTIDAIAASPIPDGKRLARYASVGGTFAARLGDRDRARRLFLLASRLEPTSIRNWSRWVASHLPATI